MRIMNAKINLLVTIRRPMPLRMREALIMSSLIPFLKENKFTTKKKKNIQIAFREHAPLFLFGCPSSQVRHSQFQQSPQQFVLLLEEDHLLSVISGYHLVVYLFGLCLSINRINTKVNTHKIKYSISPFHLTMYQWLSTQSKQDKTSECYQHCNKQLIFYLIGIHRQAEQLQNLNNDCTAVFQK